MSKRDHRQEHAGCRAVFPWDRTCAKWKNIETMLERARNEVRGIPVHQRADTFALLHEHKDHYRRRTGNRNMFISTVEGWRDRELDWTLKETRILTRDLGMTELEVLEEAAHTWNDKRAFTALAALYAYGQLNRDGTIKPAVSK